MSDLLVIVFALALLGLNAFFVGAEFALLSARRDRLEALAEGTAATRARIVLRARAEMTLMLAGAQLGITVCTIVLGRLGEPAVARQLGPLLAPLGVPDAAIHAIAFVLAVVLVSVAHILFGEMVPKNLAIARPERLALWLVPAHVRFVQAVRPLIWAFNMVANGVLRLFRVTPKDEVSAAYTPVELASLIAESGQVGLLDTAQTHRLTQTLSSVSRTVAEVMVPLARAHTLPANYQLTDVGRAVATTGYSRFPVRDSDGVPRSYLHVKDVLGDVVEPEAVNSGSSARSPRERRLPTLAAQTRLDAGLATLRQAQSHLAAVVDDTGAVAGVVALEDLVTPYVSTPGSASGGRLRAEPRTCAGG